MIEPAAGVGHLSSSFCYVEEAFHNVNPHPNGNSLGIEPQADCTRIEAANSEIVEVFQKSRNECSGGSQRLVASLRDRQPLRLTLSASQQSGCSPAEEASGISDSRTEPDRDAFERAAAYARTSEETVGRKGAQTLFEGKD